MERAIYSVAFYVKRTKTLKDETSPIYGRVTINGQRAEFSIQRSIPLDQWDYFKETKNNNSNAAKLLNRYFDEVKRKLHQYQIDIEDRGEEVTLGHCCQGVRNKGLWGGFQQPCMPGCRNTAGGSAKELWQHGVTLLPYLFIDTETKGGQGGSKIANGLTGERNRAV